MTDCVLVHWLIFVAAITFLFILSRICLFMMPMSDLDGFMSLCLGVIIEIGFMVFES